MNRLIFTICSVVLLLGCEAKPDIDNPRTEATSALEFSYPGNWKITDRTNEPSEFVKIQTITLSSPGDAVMVLTMTNPKDSMTLEAFAVESEKIRAEEIKRLLGDAEGLAKISKTKVSTNTSGIEGAGDTMIRHDFAISVMGEEVPHWGDFHHFAGDTWDVFTYSQAPREDWEKVLPGFQQVLNSIRPR